MKGALRTELDDRLEGSFRGRFLLELFGNSLHFPLANIFLEFILEGPSRYLLDPNLYALLLAALVQAWWLSRWHYRGTPRPFWGNLIGPATYTVWEVAVEGAVFFSDPHHLAYWGFGFAIGVLQQCRERAGPGWHAPLLVAEDVVRTSIILVMYAILEFLQDGYRSLGEFVADPPHLFVALLIPLLGLVLGFSRLTAYRQQQILAATAGDLRRYSEWLLGPERLLQAVRDPNALGLRRVERTLLFMDIRGFTAWSESRSPEAVVALLNGYYNAAEPVWLRHPALKVKFTADEIMLVFRSSEGIENVARELLEAVWPQLEAEGLGVGIGVHAGPVVEGLLGTDSGRGYDVLGDVVNTAKRLCDAAGSGEILFSEHLPVAGERMTCREVRLKGLSAPLSVRVLQVAGEGSRSETVPATAL